MISGIDKYSFLQYMYIYKSGIQIPFYLNYEA